MPWIIPRLAPSKKQRPSRSPIPVVARGRSRSVGPRQEGLEWQQKMQSLATRRTRRQVRRHASGAPMKRT